MSHRQAFGSDIETEEWYKGASTSHSQHRRQVTLTSVARVHDTMIMDGNIGTILLRKLGLNTRPGERSCMGSSSSKNEDYAI